MTSARETSPVTVVPTGRARRSLVALRTAAASCQACDLWMRGTQTVFGEGARGAPLMLVGEQPGDREDRTGRPFVGPAGRILDRALATVGFARDRVYVTNVVKHFKWTPRGKRRLHSKPNAAEVAACRPWLDAELAAVRPEVVVCLGATAAHALLGSEFRLTEQRGIALVSSVAPAIVATVHPSAILRIADHDARHAELDRFTRDLSVACTLIGD